MTMLSYKSLYLLMRYNVSLLHKEGWRVLAEPIITEEINGVINEEITDVTNKKTNDVICDNINDELKYPIKAYQLLTERFDCSYCISTDFAGREGTAPKANTQKCFFCGIGSQAFWLGLIIGLAEDLQLPIALIERVNCRHAKKEDIIREKRIVENALAAGKEVPENLRYEAYQVLDDKVYHCINVSSASSKGIANSQCYDARLDPSFTLNYGQKICQLDEWCRKVDIKRADYVFDNWKELAIDKEGYGIKYYKEPCVVSELHEFIMPIFSKKYQEGAPNDVIGVLIIGQIAISSEKKDLPIPKGADPEKIADLREKGWKKACEKLPGKDKSRLFTNSNDVFKEYGKKINRFIEQTRNRLEIRVTDFLHNYQADLLNTFDESLSRPRESSRTNRSDSSQVKTAIRGIFSKIKKDFAVKRIFLFFPDMDLRDVVYSPILNGESIVDNDIATCTFDTTNFTPHPSTRISIDDIKLTTSGEIKRENCEFYASAKGDNREKVVFGVLIEWNEAPEQDGLLAHLHESLFNAFVGICVGEISARVSLAYLVSQRAFAEETRHDLAHRLQTLQSHSTIFSRSLSAFENSAMNIDDCIDFIRQCYKVKNSNEDLHTTLMFLCNTLDNDNLDYSYKPSLFNPHHQIFPRLKNLYNASESVISKNQHLEISAAPIENALMYADDRMFNRIMYNLLDNAFKYGYPNTNIIIETAIVEDNKWYEIKVSNFCEGIDKDLAATMFEHGVRTQLLSEGKGLGLYVARKFAELNNGSLDHVRGTVDSESIDNPDRILNVNITCASEMWREIDRRTNENKRRNDRLNDTYRELRAYYRRQYDHPCSKIGVGEKIFRNVLEAIIAKPPREKYKSPEELLKSESSQTSSVYKSPSDEAMEREPDFRFSPEKWIKKARQPIYIVTFKLRLPTYLNI